MKKSLMKIIATIMMLFVFLGSLFSCTIPNKVAYYSEKENYISVMGTVSKIEYNEDYTVLYIDFSELSPTLDDTCFKIVGENLKISQVNGIDKKLKPDKHVSFITAPRYFGDGYIMPIVAICVDGEWLLEFHEGYDNFLKWLDE